VAAFYDRHLGNAVVVPARVPDSVSAWAIYSVLLPEGVSRAVVQARLRERGVPTAVYYPKPLHLQPAYRACHDGVSLPVSEGLAERILALPIHPYLSEEALGYVCEQVVGAVAEG
jgi:dTDP-4-amino-4,6-dideoxygalactose transaminase